MSTKSVRWLTTVWIAVLVWQSLPTTTHFAEGAYGWQGKRRVSFQKQKDLFYNYYVGPEPSGTAAQLYESPLPTPPRVGHTYVSYQPLMPHEFMYKHQRGYYTYNPGAGWTRTNVRYRTGCGLCFHWMNRLYGDSGSRFTDTLDDSISGLTRSIGARR